MRARALGLGIGLVLFILGMTLQPGMAQSQDPWTPLHRLSGLYGEASAATMIADDFGYVHVFWTESGFDSGRTLIMYSRFDGKKWSVPANIYASWPGAGIQHLDGAADKLGNLHLVWSGVGGGPLYYTTAAMEDAASPKAWKEPIQVKVDILTPKLYIDSVGTIHVVYVDYSGDQPGVYYTRSENQGKVWSFPTWLDPDIPVDAKPSWIDMAVDDLEGMHVVWSYDDTVNGVGRWVRYSHSLDGGDTWSDPFSIDYATPDDIEELALPNPGIAAMGETVHVIWAGTDNQNREDRYSEDRGMTWSDTERVFGELRGQAIADGLAFDAAGRLHWFGQLRFPMAVHHFTWQDGEWSEDEIAYLIKKTDQEEVGDRIGAHNVRVAILSGNHLVVTFTTSPQDPQFILYATDRLLDDMSPIVSLAVPTETPTATATSTLVPPTPTVTVTPFVLEAAAPEGDPSPSMPIWIGVAPAALLVALSLLVQVLRKR